jgi:hypothetical protein
LEEVEVMPPRKPLPESGSLIRVVPGMHPANLGEPDTGELRRMLAEKLSLPKNNPQKVLNGYHNRCIIYGG